MRGRCLCAEKEKSETHIAELLADFVRRRKVVITMLAQAVDNEARLSRECAREHNERQAREHLEKKAHAEADLKREQAICSNAGTLLKTLKRAHANRDFASLLREGATEMEKLAAETPDVAELVAQIRAQMEVSNDLARPLMEEEEEEEIELPSVPAFSVAQTQRDTASPVPPGPKRAAFALME